MSVAGVMHAEGMRDIASASALDIHSASVAFGGAFYGHTIGNQKMFCVSCKVAVIYKLGRLSV